MKRIADHDTGNLPSEKVSKQDIFSVFHKYGKLAQISIKQAYGFVQYLDAAACSNALQSEQGVPIRGRKIRESIGIFSQPEPRLTSMFLM